MFYSHRAFAPAVPGGTACCRAGRRALDAGRCRAALAHTCLPCYRPVFVLSPGAPGTASHQRGSAEEASLGKGVLGPPKLQGMVTFLQTRP